MSVLIDTAFSRIQPVTRYELRGTVVDVTGLIIEGNGPSVSVGTNVTIQSGMKSIAAQVVGFRGNRVLMMPYDELQGVGPGAIIRVTGASTQARVSPELLGRVLDAFGYGIDGKPAMVKSTMAPLYRDPPNPILRKRIKEPLDLGVRALNGLLTVGSGQRIGIMAGSGVGKSTLLGMIARHSKSDVNVIALVGERGREVREFIERDLGPEGLARSVVIVATGDQSALKRIRAAYYATSVAEYFRDQGKKVVLMLDSVTRLAMAQREIGLAIGEPPSTKGYTPSVFSMLPKLLERTGTSAGDGSITGLYTVLVEGDDMNEPIADATRGILDGHIVLSRRLAGKGHFPAIEVLESASRVMPDIVHPEVVNMANQARDILATYKETEDLITIGAYKPGQNPKVDRAVKLIDMINAYLKQRVDEKVSTQEAWLTLAKILAQENEVDVKKATKK